MKKIIYLFAILMLACTSLVAQPRSEKMNDFSPETRAMMRVDRLSKTVNLSAQEKQEVLELFTKQEQEREKSKQEMQANREKMQNERKAMLEKNNKDLEKILGTERYNAYKQEMQKRQGNSLHNRDNNSNHDRGNKMGSKEMKQPCPNKCNKEAHTCNKESQK